MSETPTYSQDYNKAFVDRLKALPFFVVLYATTNGLNNGLWKLDTVVVWSLIVLLVPIKLCVIIFRLFHFWRIEKKKAFILLFLPIILVFAFMFDIDTIPNLRIYRNGTETKGTVIELIKTSKSRFVIYQYSVGNIVFQKQQDVSIQYYDGVTTGAVVATRYDSNNPKISYLVDIRELQNKTWFSLFMGFGAIFISFVVEIEEKVTSIFKSLLPANKPA